MRPDTSRDRFDGMSGFSVPELLVSMSILILISISVVGNIATTRYQEELNSGARMLASMLRDVQSRAQSASSVKTCVPIIGITAVCEKNQPLCGTASCSQEVSPSVFGLTVETGNADYSTFADVNGTVNYREDLTGYERIQKIDLPRGNPTAPYVTIAGISADGVTVASSTVTFNRQNGYMRINACLSGSCTPAEASILSIDLTHAKTGKTRTVYLNAVTGRIEVQ